MENQPEAPSDRKDNFTYRIVDCPSLSFRDEGSWCIQAVNDTPHVLTIGEVRYGTAPRPHIAVAREAAQALVTFLQYKPPSNH